MKLSRWTVSALGAAVFQADFTQAIDVDLDDSDSIKSAASVIAHGMVSYYSGNETGQIPGLLPKPPYYWWEAGAMFGSLINYWYYTGDATYNNITTEALLFQVGEYQDYEPTNQTSDLGNDDQSFWAFSAMSAAELGFPNPPPNQPQWLALAQAVFNRQASRWDNATCGGGLRWQVVSVNQGWDYKNSISNGCFFTLGARLGAYTQNQTYFDWAGRMWDWMSDIGLISDAYQIFDGTSTDINCSAIDHVQWTYNSGVMLLGAATMWNRTTGDEQDTWKSRVDGLLKENLVFFKNNTIMYEVACEMQFSGPGMCDTDQLSFKAYLSRWMAATTKVAPWTEAQILPLLKSSATAAAQQCSGGTDHVTCGLRWWMNTTWDGTYGVGQQMSALEVIQSQLITQVAGPVGNNTGGTSQGDPSAGMGASTPRPASAITKRDRIGAWVLTVVVILSGLITAYWLL